MGKTSGHPKYNTIGELRGSFRASGPADDVHGAA
jgi:hypothetical protein